MYKKLITAAAALAIALGAAAAPIDNAKRLYLEGEYEEALPLLESLHKKTPRDGNAAYYLGATLVALDRGAEAVAPLTVAEARGVADASRLLAEVALADYRPEDASDHLDKWETALKKNRKATIPDALEELQQLSISMRNMMERVEKIEIIDSICVDKHDFFTHYRLSPEAGTITAGTKGGVEDAAVVFKPQCGREMIWAAGDSLKLMEAGILDDGTLDNVKPIDVDDEATAMSFPFLMPDGITLYYAAETPSSLGGYDIFMTRRTDDGEYLQPQNVGMPYNSPANDYMLAIDENAGLGWWATDRNAPEGKVTVYTFIPSAMRVNVEPDAPDLAARARITSIAATQEPGKDYDTLRRRINSMGADNTRTAAGTRSIAVALSDGRVCTSMADFRNNEARRAMESVLGVDDEIAAISADLDKLREMYRGGNKAVARRITTLESDLEKARARRASALRKVVRLEK